MRTSDLAVSSCGVLNQLLFYELAVLQPAAKPNYGSITGGLQLMYVSVWEQWKLSVWIMRFL